MLTRFSKFVSGVVPNRMIVPIIAVNLLAVYLYFVYFFRPSNEIVFPGFEERILTVVYVFGIASFVVYAAEIFIFLMRVVTLVLKFCAACWNATCKAALLVAKLATNAVGWIFNIAPFRFIRHGVARIVSTPIGVPIGFAGAAVKRAGDVTLKSPAVKKVWGAFVNAIAWIIRRISTKAGNSWHWLANAWVWLTNAWGWLTKTVCTKAVNSWHWFANTLAAIVRWLVAGALKCLHYVAENFDAGGKYFFATLGLAIFVILSPLVLLNTGDLAEPAIALFLGFVVFAYLRKIDSRSMVVTTVLFLLSEPVLIVMREDARAELAAVYAYYSLCTWVLLQVMVHLQNRSGKKEELQGNAEKGNCPELQKNHMVGISLVGGISKKGA